MVPIAAAATKVASVASRLNDIKNETYAIGHSSMSEGIEMDQSLYGSLLEEICDFILCESLGNGSLSGPYQEDGNGNGNEGGSSQPNPPDLTVEDGDGTPNSPDVPSSPPSKDAHVLKY